MCGASVFTHTHIRSSGILPAHTQIWVSWDKRQTHIPAAPLKGKGIPKSWKITHSSDENPQKCFNMCHGTYGQAACKPELKLIKALNCLSQPGMNIVTWYWRYYATCIMYFSPWTVAVPLHPSGISLFSPFVALICIFKMTHVCHAVMYTANVYASIFFPQPYTDRNNIDWCFFFLLPQTGCQMEFITLGWRENNVLSGAFRVCLTIVQAYKQAGVHTCTHTQA